MVKNIVLDFGGVLVKYDFTAHFAEVFGSREKAEAFMRQVLTKENNNAFDKGDLPVDKVLAEWKHEWPEYVLAIDDLDKHYTDNFPEEMPGMRQLMRSLKARGYRLLGLSNWSSKVHEVMAKFPAIFGLLDGSLVSYQVRLLKPDTSIYKAFCERFSVRPEECVFVDDKPANIDSAKSIGMQGIVFKDAAQLSSELRNLLGDNGLG